jgi:hypothetical protein
MMQFIDAALRLYLPISGKTAPQKILKNILICNFNSDKYVLYILCNYVYSVDYVGTIKNISIIIQGYSK